MATNPMQRKARNSFLLGMLIMLLISGAVIALLVMQLMNRVKAEKEAENRQKRVCVITQDVKTGQEITSDMIKVETIDERSIPSNATSDQTTIESYSFQDKEGNEIATMYDEKSDKEPVGYMYTKRGNGDDAKDCLVAKEEATDSYYLLKTGDGQYIHMKKENDNSISFLVDNDGEQKCKLNTNEDTGEYTGEYTLEGNSRRQAGRYDREYIEITNVPLIAKVNMNKNTVITTELLSKGDNKVQNDRRKQEYNMVVLPMDLTTGDYIDIRLMLPSGQDYIVVAKKEVEIPQINGVDSETTIWVNLTEDEILHMSCAIIDAYQIQGAKIYATKYTEAGMQEAATPTYPLNESTTTLLRNDPNILQKAMNEIVDRNNESSVRLRNEYINSVINNQGDQAQSNIQTKMQESITNSQTSRKEYLDSLAGVVK